MLIKAKKTLGQHFLRSERALKTIIKTARLAAGETVLEIGPGRGVLTEALLAADARVIAVEKDDCLISFLQNKFARAVKDEKLILIHDDILEFDLASKLKAKTYKLVANLPYYLTGRILRQFLTATHQPQAMVLMLQKEVARRIVAGGGKESILSISVKVYGEPCYIMTVPAAGFYPQPKVDSAVVLIDQINKKNFPAGGEEKFFTLLKRGFGGKRKMVKNNLTLPAKVLSACRIVPTARAENLNLNQWLCLAKHF
ncbi:MAG: 16S rRNA (adenine(1518)-N(6)/adenine(1519)-N(6))-dimethyltransferase RsmA [Patescibacteria group bacterium]